MATTPLDRAQFAVTNSYRYFNHAGMTPLPRVAVEAGIEFIEDQAARGGVGFTDWEQRIEAVRGSSARLMGVPVGDVAFVKNTTEGLGFVANGLSWAPGDRVLVPDREFPSTLYPWLSLRDQGVEVDLLDPLGTGWTLPVERFDEHLRARPARVVALSWVQFARGYRTDLAALATVCHRHGALLCVDAIQGLGVIPADFEDWGVDFATADAHKWMLGPFGTGVLYVAGRHRDTLRPLEPGWASVAHRDDYENLDLIYADSARRFEGGSHTMETILEMGASIDLLLDAGDGEGVGAVWRHVDGLLDHLAEQLRSLGATVVSDRSPDGRSANLTLTLDDTDHAELLTRLAAEGFVCSARGGGIRVSPHGYNTIDEIDAFVDALRLAPLG